ncbi:heavy-metal-associated domain-containing protein [Rhodococcus sp. G-MC3]|uniref:heavy-metal-associated domain-containing protein n=1 Tax=Rhodococcus sp. G-MC3 TaxID=3046209 RepID=UPI0024BAC13B|nr:heavy-metal-associated domain-containing protein [Rhodococcus sp. G-MC3]MDJ0392097.1 heavy-metal-associated domain-containing protein [Rhodococcus sp. G-MC3]
MESSFIVEGMTCRHCAESVSEEISEIGGVTDVTVDVESGAVVVSSERAIADSSVAAAVVEAGYRLSV